MSEGCRLTNAANSYFLRRAGQLVLKEYVGQAPIQGEPKRLNSGSSQVDNFIFEIAHWYNDAARFGLLSETYVTVLDRELSEKLSDERSCMLNYLWRVQMAYGNEFFESMEHRDKFPEIGADTDFRRIMQPYPMLNAAWDQILEKRDTLDLMGQKIDLKAYRGLFDSVRDQHAFHHDGRKLRNALIQRIKEDGSESLLIGSIGLGWKKTRFHFADMADLIFLGKGKEKAGIGGTIEDGIKKLVSLLLDLARVTVMIYLVDRQIMEAPWELGQLKGK